MVHYKFVIVDIVKMVIRTIATHRGFISGDFCYRGFNAETDRLFACYQRMTFDLETRRIHAVSVVYVTYRASLTYDTSR